MVYLSKNRFFLFALLVGLLGVASCASEPSVETSAVKEETMVQQPEKEKKKFQMYELSEMSALMRQMYQLNEQLKERILEGEDLGDFPKSLENMLSAEMTDNKEIDAFFEEHAKSFLSLQEKIYQDSLNAKLHFNAAIDACIQCHRVKCTGPIPKIEKLLIKE